MRFEVPQFIDIEDKIFGQLTFKQFIYVAGGIGACAFLVFQVPFWLFLIIAPFIVALSVGLAFMPINQRPLSLMLEAILLYFARARLYLWKKTERTPTPTPAAELRAEQEYAPSASVSGSSIASLSRDLELKSLNQNNGTPTS